MTIKIANKQLPYSIHIAILAVYLLGYVIFFPVLFDIFGFHVGMLIIPPTLSIALVGRLKWAILAALFSVLFNWLIYGLMAPIPFFSSQNEVVWVSTAINAMLVGLIGYTRSSEFQKHDQSVSMEALRNRLLQEEALSNVIRLLTSGDDLNQSMRDVAEILGRFYEVPRAGVALLNPSHTAAVVAADYHQAGTSSSLGEVIPIEGNASMEYIMQRKEVLVIEDAQNDPMMAPVNELMKQHGVVSILLIPILVDGSFVGSIGFDSPVKRSFSDEEKQFGQRVANLIGNVIQRKKVEQEIKDSRDFALQIMETMGQGLIVGDIEGSIIYCNQQLGRLLTEKPDELIGQKFNEIFREITIHENCDDSIWISDHVVQFEAPIHGEDGRLLYVLIDLVPRRKNEEVVGFTAVVTDLTARYEIENALEQAKAEALEASRLKSEFLASMSHEIRTPLNGVIGMTSLLLQSNLNSEQQDYAQTIRSSGDQLLSIINDILDFSKIEAGKLELEKEPFDVRECVEEALDVLVASAAVKQLELVYRIDPEVPATIVGDVTRVRQILVNLVSNAVKFTNKGEILVHVQGDRRSDSLYEWQFSIKDTGIGIPPERMNRLFRSFSQVDSSTTRKFGGTGLGLAICKRLTELMGGRIWVESELGVGSTFHFSIVAPIGEGQNRVYMRQLAELQNKVVLIVDDNHTNRRILRDQLNHWGIRTAEADSAPAALEKLHSDQQFDLAILDMQMPTIDGLALARQIRSEPQFKKLPLIMLSSISHRTDRSDLFAAFLSKPVKTSQLHQVLLSTLENSSQTSGSGVQAAGQADHERLGDQYPLHILLVEDNAINQKVALHLLGRLGYRADLAGNGQEALEALRRQSYQLVLMDAQMPEMDGLEATEIIRREIDPLQQPYIIALTANAMVHQKEAYLAIGMDDYLSKPVRLEDLEEAIAAALPKIREKTTGNLPPQNTLHIGHRGLD